MNRMQQDSVVMPAKNRHGNDESYTSEIEYHTTYVKFILSKPLSGRSRGKNPEGTPRFWSAPEEFLVNEITDNSEMLQQTLKNLNTERVRKRLTLLRKMLRPWFGYREEGLTRHICHG